MKNLLEVLTAAKNFLQEKQVLHARREAEDLLAFVLSLNRMELYLQHDRPLIEQEIDKYRDFIKRRAKKEPSAYIMGEVDFYGTSLQISNNVLIPRQETELLVDLIVNKISKIDLEGKTLVDICTGSGCIAIALKKRFPKLKVIGIDLSNEALQIARKNAALNEVEVEFLEGDGLNPLLAKADFIVSNPPYVTEAEYGNLEDEVRLFEPKMALVSGKSGIEFYERFEKELLSRLNSGAQLFFEIGETQGNSVEKIFSKPCWRSFKIEKDYSQKERFISLEFE